ncbi:hypothetical protein ACEPAF_5658 [Sanghuangporus sanghuang]
MSVAIVAVAVLTRAALIPTSISIATTISLDVPEVTGLPINQRDLPSVSIHDLPLPTSLPISLPLPVPTSLSLSLPLPLPTDTTISLELPLPTGVNL